MTETKGMFALKYKKPHFFSEDLLASDCVKSLALNSDTKQGWLSLFVSRPFPDRLPKANPEKAARRKTLQRLIVMMLISTQK